MPQLKPIRGIQLSKSYPFARGLVVLCPFYEGTGKRVFDLSGNGILGTLSSSVSWDAGSLGSGLSFPLGGTESVVCSNYSVTDNLPQFTWIIRFKPTGWGTNRYGRIFAKPAHFMSVDTGGELSFKRNTDGTNAYFRSANGVLVLNTYHTVAVTYDDNGDREIHLFVNGVELSSFQTKTAATGTLLDDSEAFIIGNTPDTSRQFEGLIEFVYLFDRVLSSFEITEITRKPFVMFEPALNVARISSVVVSEFIEIAGTITAASILTDTAALRRTRVIAGGVTARSSLAGSIKVSRKISGVIAATSSLSGELSLVGEVSRSRGSGFKPIEGAERLRGLRRSAFY